MLEELFVLLRGKAGNGIDDGLTEKGRDSIRRFIEEARQDSKILSKKNHRTSEGVIRIVYPTQWASLQTAREIKRLLHLTPERIQREDILDWLGNNEYKNEEFYRELKLTLALTERKGYEGLIMIFDMPTRSEIEFFERHVGAIERNMDWLPRGIQRTERREGEGYYYDIRKKKLYPIPYIPEKG